MDRAGFWGVGIDLSVLYVAFTAGYDLKSKGKQPVRPFSGFSLANRVSATIEARKKYMVC